jgi:hypothetical protein
VYKTQINSPFEYFVGLLSVVDPFEGVEPKIKKISKIPKPVKLSKIIKTGIFDNFL